MTASLSAEQIQSYGEYGCRFPARVLSEAEAARYRAELEAFEAGRGGRIEDRRKRKLYLRPTWVNDPAVAADRDAAADTVLRSGEISPPR